jgi:hypothetical protein
MSLNCLIWGCKFLLIFHWIRNEVNHKNEIDLVHCNEVEISVFTLLWLLFVETVGDYLEAMSLRHMLFL